MSEERKDISELLKEYYNRPLELIEENKKLKKKIDKLQKENKNYKELILAIKEKLNNIQFEVEQAWRKIEKLESKDE